MRQQSLLILKLAEEILLFSEVRSFILGVLYVPKHYFIFVNNESDILLILEATLYLQFFL